MVIIRVLYNKSDTDDERFTWTENLSDWFAAEKILLRYSIQS